MKKILKIFICIVIIIIILISIAYLIDRNRMKNNKSVIFSTWGYSYAPPVEIKQEEKIYSKTIDETTIELNIPNEWSYEEITSTENDNYKFALKIYKNSNEKGLMLYVYNNQFGVCGTGLTKKEIKLNNGKNATVGYYDGIKEWSYVSFYEMNKNMAFINNGLEEDEANEAIEIIKTINMKNV